MVTCTEDLRLWKTLILVDPTSSTAVAVVAPVAAAMMMIDVFLLSMATVELSSTMNVLLATLYLSTERKLIRLRSCLVNFSLIQTDRGRDPFWKCIAVVAAQGNLFADKIVICIYFFGAAACFSWRQIGGASELLAFSRKFDWPRAGRNGCL